MLVVVPFCIKDWVSAVKNLEWAKELDGHLDFHAILAHEESTPPEHVGEAKRAAEALFSKVTMFWYPDSVKKSWPAGPNWSWQNCARYIAHFHPNESWFWWEADAIPIRKRWLTDIAEEHVRGGQPFSGHVVEGLGHLTGVAVYPGMVAEYSYNAMMCEEMAWDVVLGKDIQGKVHAAHTLFQHSWCINPETGKAWNGNGQIPTFKDTHDLVRLVDLSMALFHRNKDGTLIEQLRRFYAHPEEAMVPQHTKTEAVEVQVLHEANGARHQTAGGTEAQPEPDLGQNRVPELGAGTKDGKPPARVSQPFTGKCEILIVTYHKDAPWLQYALATMQKHARGFNGITIALPKRDRNHFAWLGNIDVGMPIRVQLYDEAPGKGMIHHMAMMASADRLVPDDVTHILHFDADCMVKETITPDSYFNGTKPIYVIRSYTGLTDPASKVVSDCIQWQVPTQAQLGFDTDIYTMCRHPTGFPREFYAEYRNHIERVQKRDFFAYMLSGRNSHPTNRMDFTAFGAFAYRYLHDKFDWWNVDNEPAPVDLVKPYWSHGGVTDAVKAEIEGFLK